MARIYRVKVQVCNHVTTCKSPCLTASYMPASEKRYQGRTSRTLQQMLTRVPGKEAVGAPELLCASVCPPKHNGSRGVAQQVHHAQTRMRCSKVHQVLSLKRVQQRALAEQVCGRRVVKFERVHHEAHGVELAEELNHAREESRLDTEQRVPQDVQVVAHLMLAVIGGRKRWIMMSWGKLISWRRVLEWRHPFDSQG